MNQKANSLTDIINLFHPKALTGEQIEFYQPTSAARDGSSYEFHEGLYRLIEKSIVHERLLVVGHGGCGKSTELNMLIKKLSTSGYPVTHIEALENLDLFNFNYIDIFMLIVEKIIHYAESKDLNVNERLITAFNKALLTKTIKEYLHEEDEAGMEGGVSTSVSIPYFLAFLAKVTASLKMSSGFKEELRNEIKPRIYDIAESLNALIEDLNGQSPHPIVILIDGLEKCRHEGVRKLFIEDISTIASIRAHLVVSCPISIFCSVDAAILSSYFSAPVVIPMIKTHDRQSSPDSKGINVIRDLIKKRADDTFFEKDVLDTIITKAGGSLRDTCYLLRSSAFEADMRNRGTIDLDSVNIALRKFANEVFFRANAKHYSRIEAIYNGDHTARQDAASAELLYSGAVFEYNGERWRDLHPLVRQYIDENPEVLKS